MQVRVSGVPSWVNAPALLGPGNWLGSDGTWTATLERDAAADVAARLRGVGLGGGLLTVEVTPPLKRLAVREARLRDARARRVTTPGFTRSGLRLDEEGRMSLTPESLARAIGLRAGGAPVVDAGCGCGGNTIGFALAGSRVTAIDQDAGRLAMARHNASLYGVADRIAFLHGDAAALIPTLPPQLVFVDPPWGAEWNRVRTGLADLPTLRPILDVASGPVWCKVPPSFDPDEVAGAVPEAWFGTAEGDRHRVKFVLLTRG